MCLMCEFYYDSCWNDECYDAAIHPDEKYMSNSRENPRKIFLHMGYTGPCKHMRADHGPECYVIEKHEDPKYGMIYDTCNCERDDEKGWIYYV